MDKILLISIGLYVVIGAIAGYCRGLKRSVVRICCVIASGIIAFFAAKPVAASLAAKAGLSEGISLSGEDAMSAALAANETITAVLQSVPTIVISLLTYVVIFLVAELVMYIPQAIANAKFPKEKRFGGLGVGALSGALVFILSFAPIIYILNLGTQIYQQIPQSYKDEISEEFKETFSEVSETAGVDEEDAKEAFQAFDSALQPGTVTEVLSKITSPITDNLTSVEINGEKTSLAESVEDLVPLIEPIIEVAETVSEIDIDDTEQLQEILQDDNVNTIIEKVTSNQALIPVVDTIVNTAIAENIPEEILKDKETMSVAADAINEINSGNESSEHIQQLAKEAGFELPPAAIQYLCDYAKREFEGTDWTAETLAQKLSEIKNSADTE